MGVRRGSGKDKGGMNGDGNTEDVAGGGVGIWEEEKRRVGLGLGEEGRRDRSSSGELWSFLQEMEEEEEVKAEGMGSVMEGEGLRPIHRPLTEQADRRGISRQENAAIGMLSMEATVGDAGKEGVRTQDGQLVSGERVGSALEYRVVEGPVVKRREMWLEGAREGFVEVRVGGTAIGVCVCLCLDVYMCMCMYVYV